MHTFLCIYVAQSGARMENHHKHSCNHQLWADLQSQPQAPQGRAQARSGSTTLTILSFLKKKNHTTLQIAKVYPVLHKKEVGSEHLSMLDYTAELK